MESLYFDVLQFLYHLALAILVGGAIFGALGRSDGLAIVAVVVLVLTSVLKATAFEITGVPETRLVARWIALVVVCGATLYTSAWANPVARAVRAQTPGYDDLRPDAPARRETQSLDRSSKRGMTLIALAGTVALFLS